MAVVAKLRTLRASTRGDYVLRGVVPVPTNVRINWKRGAPSPLSIVDRDGKPVPTQWQPATAIAGNRITSVELAARVQPADSESAIYKVIDDPQPRRRTKEPDAVPGPAAASLLDEGLVLYAYNEEQQLFTARIRRDACGQCDRQGHVLCTRMDAGTLRMSDHEDPTRGKTLLGFNAWLTWFADSDVVLLDLFVHNAHTGRRDAGNAYFQQLGLLLTDDWTWDSLWPMPSISDPYLVKEQIEGSHVIVPRHGLVFRLVLFRKHDRATALEMRANRGWAVCEAGKDLWSWSNARCGFGAHQLPLPKLQGATERELADDPRPWGIVRRALSRGGDSHGPWKTFGTYPESPYLPWGSFQGGMTSGTEIHACEGAKLAWTGLPDQLSAWFAAQKMYTDRCPVWLIDPTTQMPAQDQLTPGRTPNWVLGATVEFTQGERGWGFSARERSLDRDSLPEDAPEYLAQLSRYGTIDFAHYTRVTSKFIVPALLDNDPLSKFGVRMFGELGFMFAQRRIGEFTSEARRRPGRGGFMTRTTGWALHAMASAAHVGTEQDRKRIGPFVEQLSSGLRAAIMPNGHVHAQTDGRLGSEFGGRYAVNSGISIGIPPIGQLALARVAGYAGAREALQDLVVRQAIGMRELRWRPGQAGIITRVGVWKKPSGVPFQTLKDIPSEALSNKESNFYSGILLGLALWLAPKNATLLRAFDDFVERKPRAFFDDRDNHEAIGSFGWLWSWWQNHGG